MSRSHKLIQQELHIFYAPEMKPPLVLLSEEESAHCIRVLRLTTGSEVLLVNGQGLAYKAVITDPHPKRCLVTTTEPYPFGTRFNYSLCVAIAPTKNLDRFEWFLEKATEIGVSRIVPLLCDRSERKSIPQERLSRLLVAGMKQSQKSFLPRLDSLCPFDLFMKEAVTGVKTVAHLGNGTRKPLWDFFRCSEPITVLIGPEGDFSEREVLLAIEQGYQPITLGLSRLRTETAGIVVCQSISLLSQMEPL
ncbi:MAG: 16S rRNA (uracil(1498)-N(3))-methyltransferase [Bacteroidales bacterium]